MYSQQQLSVIKGAKVLMVGAGGIGCELLKALALSGFQDIHIFFARVLGHDVSRFRNLVAQFSGDILLKLANPFGFFPLDTDGALHNSSYTLEKDKFVEL